MHEGIQVPEMMFKDRFGFDPRPFQSFSIDTVLSMGSPGLIVIEAPMGEGKTEAALGMAEILAIRFGLTGAFFALPTQATSDGLFPRVVRWIEKASIGQDSAKSIFLAHGKADFNDEFNLISNRGSYSTEDSLIVHDWFRGRKKGILSDFVVGTVDQILMAGLKRKHLSLRHLGLANKVVIIDEVHAYDEYMGSYLEKSLSWLGAFNVPVILLSATLPTARRKKLVEAYLSGKRVRPKEGSWEGDARYPLMTVACGQDVDSELLPSSDRRSSVLIRKIHDDSLIKEIDREAENGGYVGIVVNTVDRAQKISCKLERMFGEESVELLHSRFAAYDRAVNETRVMNKLRTGRKKPPFKLFVVGTQVMEQSLDLDFDVLFTDICPMDLLIQRIGRLHRHKNVRPKGLEEPICNVVCDGEGRLMADVVYGKYMIYNTDLLLPKMISLPDDISGLVQSAYGGILDVRSELKEDYDRAYEENLRLINDKETRAKQFQVCSPNVPNLMSWLDDDLQGGAEVEAKATVRDINATLEVTMLRMDGNGRLETVSGAEIETVEDGIDDYRMPTLIASNRISLPYKLISQGRIGKVIDELTGNRELLPKSLRDSNWAEGELFMILDSQGTAEICGSKLRYSKAKGLEVDTE